MNDSRATISSVDHIINKAGLLPARDSRHKRGYRTAACDRNVNDAIKGDGNTIHAWPKYRPLYEVMDRHKTLESGRRLVDDLGENVGIGERF
jgi:hypothetical protein